MTSIFAPGKLMVGGEYAVLDGAPALVQAVSAGVTCLVTAHPHLRIDTPDGDDRFVRAALEEIGAPSAHYRFSNVGMEGLQSKPGVGGSAAATVAAVRAGGGEGLEAYGIHHRVQGSGSGADVAASLYGGLIRFQPNSPFPTVRRLPPVRPVVIFTGQSAKTGPRVAQYRAWAPEARQSFVSDMTAAVDNFSAQPITATKEMGALLLSMALKAHIDYDTPALVRIRALAAQEGGAARASGAGGGDSAIAFFNDADQENAFIQTATADGFMILPLKPAAPTGLIPYQEHTA